MKKFKFNEHDICLNPEKEVFVLHKNNKYNVEFKFAKTALGKWTGSASLHRGISEVHGTSSGVSSKYGKMFDSRKEVRSHLIKEAIRFFKDKENRYKVVLQKLEAGIIQETLF